MLNPSICAIFMFQGFLPELSYLCDLRSKIDPDASNREFTRICETLAGGQVECAAWFATFAERVCEACEFEYMASEQPGVWYYDIGEWLGHEVACRASNGDVNEKDILALAVKMTRNWDDMRTPSDDLVKGYVVQRLTDMGVDASEPSSVRPGIFEWDIPGCTASITQRVGNIQTLTILPEDGSWPLVHENLFFFGCKPEVFILQ